MYTCSTPATSSPPAEKTSGATDPRAGAADSAKGGKESSLDGQKTTQGTTAVSPRTKTRTRTRVTGPTEDDKNEDSTRETS